MMVDTAPCSAYVLPLLLTIAIEAALAFALGIRMACDQGRLVLTNVLTNLCLNAIIVVLAEQVPEPVISFVVMALECVIVICEARMLDALGVSFAHVPMRMRSSPVICSFVLNVGSYGAGLLLPWLTGA